MASFCRPSGGHLIPITKPVMLGLVFLFHSLGSLGQTTLFSENVGTPGGTTAIATYAAGSAPATFQNKGLLNYSGSGDIRLTTASSGYTGASGNGNVFLTNNSSASFEIASISTVGYNNLILSFGALKTTIASDMSELRLEYSTDGSTYTTVSIPSQPTGSGTAVWRLISGINLPIGANGASNLRLRWRQTSSGPQFRIDDIKLTATPATPSVQLSVSPSTGTEAAQTDVTVTATASAAVTGNQTVLLTVTGTNITTGDYTLGGVTTNTATITILNGQTTGSIIFKVVDDALVESAETAILTLSSPSSGLVLGSTITQNIDIVDNDTYYVDITNVGAPAAGNIGIPTSDQLLFGFQLSPNNSADFTAVNIATTGGTGLNNFRLVRDVDNSGTYNVGDIVLSTIATLSNPLSFSGFTETISAAARYLIIGDVPGAVANNSTFRASINSAASVTTTLTETLSSGTGFTQTFVAIPQIAITDNGTQVAAGNIQQGTYFNLLSSFVLTEGNYNPATLTQITVSTTGSYRSSDIVNNGIRLWYSSTNNFAGASNLKSISSSGATGSGETVTFGSLNQAIAKAASGYFWITVDLVTNAVVNRTIRAGAIAPTNLNFSLANVSGSASIAGTQTIIAPLVPIISLNQTGIPQVGAQVVYPGDADHIISNFRATVSGLDAILEELNFTINGTFTAGDVTNFKLYSSATATFPGGVPLATLSGATLSGGSLLSFLGLNYTNPVGNNYYWITADVAAAGISTPGQTIQVPTLPNSAFTFTSANFGANSITAAGVQTIAGTPSVLVITSVSPTSPVQGSSFNITVQVQDGLGNPTNVTTDTYINLSKIVGTGGFSFPNDPGPTEVIPTGANSVIVTGAAYSIAETNISLGASVASGMSLTASSPFVFNVIAGSNSGNQFWDGVNTTAWLTTSNWASGSYPGLGSTAANYEVAVFANPGKYTQLNAIGGAGINMNTLGGNLSVGAIYFNTDYAATHTSPYNLIPIGNSSGTVAGTLHLNAASVSNIGGTGVNYSTLLIGNYANTANTTTLRIRNGVASNTSNFLKLNLVRAGYIVAGVGRSIELYTEIMGSNNVTFAGGGTFVLNPQLPDGSSILTGNNSTNLWTSLLTVADGRLDVGNSGAFNNNTVVLGATTPSVTAGTLRLNGNSVTLGGLRTQGTAASAVENESNTNATLTVNNTSSNTFAGTIKDYTTSGTGVLSFVKTGMGVLSLTGTNTYTGTTTVSDGTLQLNNTAALSASTPVTVNGGTLRVSQNITLTNITITSGVLSVDNGRTLTINGTLTYSGGSIVSTSGTGIIAYGPSGKLIYNGTAQQNTGIELPNASYPAETIIDNAADVVLSANKTIANLLTLNQGALILNGRSLTLSGTLSRVNGFFTGDNAANLIITGSGNLGSSLIFTNGANLLNNLTINRSAATVTLGSDLTVGGIYIPTDGILAIGTNNLLTLKGTIAAAGTGTLSGSATSELAVEGTAGGNLGTINFTTGSQQLYNLFMNRSGANAGAILGTPLLVSGTLNMSGGLLTTTSANLLTIGTSGSSPGGSSTSFVKGPLAKQMATGATTEFTFPIGKGTSSYKPAYVLPVNTPATTTYTAEYFVGNPALTYNVPFTGMPTQLVALDKYEYWDITKQNVAGSSARVALDYPALTNPSDWVFAGGIVSPPSIPPNTNVAIAHMSGAVWEFTKTSGNFQTVPATYEATYYPTPLKLYSAVMTSFSPFTFGFGNNTILVLPLKLTRFAGWVDVSTARLNWSVEEIKDLDHFEMEYSTDGLNFILRDRIAAGNGNSFHYDDPRMEVGRNYYRLVMVDKDGKKYYSQVVLLQLAKARTYLVGISPTVVNNQLYPVIFSTSAQKASAFITDITGRKLAETNTQLQAGTNRLELNTSMLPKGIYQVTIITSDNTKETRRFLKE